MNNRGRFVNPIILKRKTVSGLQVRVANVHLKREGNPPEGEIGWVGLHGKIKKGKKKANASVLVLLH